MRRDSPFRRMWHKLEMWIPTLNENEQAIIQTDMRHNAIATVDFNLLILLASGIAYFGLRQDSAVVIIGAMLVAPLMSPMMAMGFAIINGNFPLFRRAAVSTLIGIGLAVGMATVVTFLFPSKTITGEIVARTNPNLLDLFIALISGLAGAYALGRKEVSASLPGVAIAASLVPPLCVVGYGLGTLQWRVATNSLLLFSTNLASIIVAGIIMFWLLGFRPDSTVDQRLFQTSIRFAILAVLLVSVPLLIFTLQNTIQTTRQADVERILQTEIDPAVAEIEDIQIRAVESGFVVGMTIFLYDQAATETETQQRAINDIQLQLEQAVGGPVTIQARVIPASLTVFERVGLSPRVLEP